MASDLLQILRNPNSLDEDVFMQIYDQLIWHKVIWNGLRPEIGRLTWTAPNLGAVRLTSSTESNSHSNSHSTFS